MVFFIKKNIVEENFFAFCRYLGMLNSSCTPINSIVAMSTGVPVSDMNWVYTERPLHDNATDAVAKIKKYYEKLNLRFWWWVSPVAQSPETDRILKDAGFRLYTKATCMAADLQDSLSDSDCADNIKIISVKNNQDLLVWKDISFAGFEIPDSARKQYERFVLSFDLSAKSPQKLFVACFNEKPVASSMLFVHENTAGIYYVSTLPAYRNKGCGLKITLAAMKEARDAGFKDIILQATPMGLPVYKKAGFREYCQAHIYEL
ncbi:MAG: GNAT family N-acetyltransferase [Smithella sp.]